MQYKWIALTVTTVGVLMSGINSGILIVGLPTIGKQTGANLSELIWITQAYVLAITVTLPIIGRVTDILGRVKIYNIGFLIFTIGSGLACASFSIYMLIGCRLVQGVGSAMLITNSTAILADATPRNELGTILGMNNVAFTAGSMAGLTLSGVILAFANWRALFFINVPIGIFGTIWAQKRLKEIYTKDTAQGMDWAGFLTFSPSLTFLLLSITILSYGLSGVAFGTLLLAGGVALLILFVILELKKYSAPLLDFNLFKIREFASANLAQTLYGLVYSGVVLMLSFYLQIVMGYSVLQAGLSIIPLNVAFLIMAPISGRLSDRHGPRVLSSLGLGIMTIGFLFLSTISKSTGYSEIALILVILGFGNGMFVSPNMSALMRSVPAHRRGIASGFRATTFNAAMTASYGLVVLLITVALPYTTFSALLQGNISQTIITVAKAQFLSGFKIAVLILAVINASAIIPSMLRGSSETKENKPQIDMVD